MKKRIPASFIEELLEKADLREVIGSRLGVELDPDIGGLCPFCGGGKFHTISGDLYHCFDCQAGGTALAFLMEHEDMGFVKAVITLAGSLGLEVPRVEVQQ